MRRVREVVGSASALADDSPRTDAGAVPAGPGSETEQPEGDSGRPSRTSVVGRSSGRGRVCDTSPARPVTCSPACAVSPAHCTSVSRRTITAVHTCRRCHSTWARLPRARRPGVQLAHTGGDISSAEQGSTAPPCGDCPAGSSTAGSNGLGGVVTSSRTTPGPPRRRPHKGRSDARQPADARRHDDGLGPRRQASARRRPMEKGALT